MQFHLIRHGETDWNVQRRIQGQLDTELNANGRDQALARGRELAPLDLTAVYCSSSIRTQQTADLILGEKLYDVVLRDDLREINFGAWQGCYWADIEREQPEEVAAVRTCDPNFRVDEAETYYELQARGVQAIESIISEHQDGGTDDHVLIVSHGALIKSVIGYYAGVPVPEIPGYPSLPNCAHSILVADRTSRRFATIAGEQFAQTPWQHAA